VVAKEEMTVLLWAAALEYLMNLQVHPGYEQVIMVFMDMSVIKRKHVYYEIHKVNHHLKLPAPMSK
jgi:hypothetical protein